MKEIELTKGQVVLVDDEDYDRLMEHKWYALKRQACGFFAARNIRKVINGKSVGRTHYMHREIMNPPDDMQVDHIDWNGLNNTKSNLRVCTSQQNCRHQRKLQQGNSKWKGVTSGYWNGNKRWRASISIGLFKTELEAAAAYNEAAKLIFKEYAVLNNIPEEGGVVIEQ